jgi:zinc D-Ala-D-Ala carboxypeptidase
MDWTGIKHFKSSEFDSPDLPTSGERMDKRLVVFLDLLRSYLGRPVIITSGYRTEAHNKAVGGAANSAHLRGKAADISCTDSVLRYTIVRYAIQCGIRRIECSKKHVHVDIDDTLPQNVLILM